MLNCCPFELQQILTFSEWSGLSSSSRFRSSEKPTLETLLSISSWSQLDAELRKTTTITNHSPFTKRDQFLLSCSNGVPATYHLNAWHIASRAPNVKNTTAPFEGGMWTNEFTHENMRCLNSHIHSYALGIYYHSCGVCISEKTLSSATL